MGSYIWKKREFFLVCQSLSPLDLRPPVFLFSCYSTVEREKVFEEWAEVYGSKHKMIATWNDAVRYSTRVEKFPVA